jgi:hypothetical protein
MMDAAMETETTPTAETSPRAPGDLWLLQELVNTRDITPNTDELADVASLRAWLTARSLLDGAEAASLGPGDLARLTAFREALRAMLRANHGEPLWWRPSRSARRCVSASTPREGRDWSPQAAASTG